MIIPDSGLRNYERDGIIIAGTSGQAKEYLLTLDEIDQWQYIGCCGPLKGNIPFIPKILRPYLGRDEQVFRGFRHYGDVAILIGIGDPQIKSQVFKKIHKSGIASSPWIIHPSAHCNMKVVSLMPGVVIQPHAALAGPVTIGLHTLVNRLVSIGHDVQIGECCTINPFASISGNVQIADKVLVGTGAKILEGIKIGQGATIGAGAVVTRDVVAGQTVVGIPARRLK